MAHEWIAAATALRYLSDEPYPYNEQRAICERAYSGLIVAKADLLIGGVKEQSQALVPKGFWWAKGHEALEQNWVTGDFSTWIDQKFELKAFGVSFDLLGVSELAPAERRAAGMQRISVASDPEWISAKELQRLIFAGNAISKAGPIILEASVMGLMVARAVRATGVIEANSRQGQKVEWAAREWDVPLWFWRDFTNPDSSMQDWVLGKARGRGFRNRSSETIELQGLHFHRAGLSSLGLLDPDADVGLGHTSNRGRRAKYDWPAACVAIYGEIERGDLKPGVQADIEKALQAHLANGDLEPSESTVRPFAKLIWEESQKA